MSESWDSDHDFVLPPGTFSLHIPGASDTEDASSSGGGASALFSGPENDLASSWDEDAGWHGAGDVTFTKDPFDRSALSTTTTTELDLPRTKEDEDQSSTDSSRNGTLKGLLTSFSGLSLASPTTEVPNPTSPSASASSLDGSDASSMPGTPKPRSASPTSRTPSTMKTIRHSSQLSNLLAFVSTGPGRVHHLGSTPQGGAKSVLGDWDEDLELDDLGLPNDLGDRPLRGKASFASHISDDPDDELLERGLPTPRTSRKTTIGPSTVGAASRKKASSDFTDIEDGDFDLESDFELPSDLSQVTLSPLLSRPSLTSLHSHSRSSSLQIPLPTGALPLPLPLPMNAVNTPSSRHSTASPALSIGGETTEDDASDDEAFFDELVLPSYFLGGPGLMTPPSDGEGRFTGGKVDLQAVLKRKLEARGGRGIEESGGKTLRGLTATPSRLDGYREGKEHEENGEAGLVIGDGVKLGAERMRTRSGPQPPALLNKGRRTTTALGSPNAHRFTRPPPLPRSSSSASASSALSSTSTIRYPSSLSRSGSSSSLVTLPGNTTSARSPHSSTSTASPGPSPNRPASAAGAVERVPRERRHAGPPPAPSTAARDRVRTRTTSLRPSNSSADLRGAAASSGAKRIPPRIDTSRERTHSSTSILLSPVPMTPTPASSTSSLAPPPPTRTTPFLRSKKSQTDLLATPSRTIERKRSMQNLSTGISTSRPLRSPTPSGSSMPGSPVITQATPRSSSVTGRNTPTASSSSSFAAPTASSKSRTRERVISNPSAPPSPSIPSQPPRPPSSASLTNTRLLQPTLASASKARARVLSSSHPLAGLRIPSTTLNLARPKRGRMYGDGTELDGFDDLVVGKEEKERSASLGIGGGGGGPASRRTSGASSATGGTFKMGSGGTIKQGAGKAGKKVMSGGGDGVESKKEDGKSSAAASPIQIKKKRRTKEPQLIRNLGPVGVSKVHGEMTWNPSQQRWEGNESVLRDFDKALSTSTRPALITQLSTGSPSRVGFPTTFNAPKVPPHLANNVKVVGSMVFDPVRMSWHSLDEDGEDELDLMFGEEGDMADDEGDRDERDGWEKGEKDRMLKNRASFVRSEGEGEGDEEEAREGERRHRREMVGGGWTLRISEVDEERRWLWDIRDLIMDSRPS